MQEKLEKIDRIEQNNAVLTEKPTMNHSSAPVTPSKIVMSNKMDPEEVPIAKTGDNLPEIQFINDVSQKTSNNSNPESSNGNDSSTTKL